MELLLEEGSGLRSVRLFHMNVLYGEFGTWKIIFHDFSFVP